MRFGSWPLQRGLDALKGKAPTTVDEVIEKTDLLFTLYIMKCPFPTKFKMNQLEIFNWTEDPLGVNSDLIQQIEAQFHRIFHRPHKVICHPLYQGDQRSTTHLLNICQEQESHSKVV